MNNDQFNQYDAEQFHHRIAEDLGVTFEELKTWMINDIERVTEGGKEVGHLVVFRESTPPDVLERVNNKQSQFTAMAAVTG